MSISSDYAYYRRSGYEVQRFSCYQLCSRPGDRVKFRLVLKYALTGDPLMQQCTRRRGQLILASG